MRKDNGVRTPPVFSFRILNTYHAQHTTLNAQHPQHLHSYTLHSTLALTLTLASSARVVNPSINQVRCAIYRIYSSRSQTQARLPQQQQ